jgi:hypothetical protein
MPSRSSPGQSGDSASAVWPAKAYLDLRKVVLRRTAADFSLHSSSGIVSDRFRAPRVLSGARSAQWLIEPGGPAPHERAAEDERRYECQRHQHAGGPRQE